MLVDAEGTITFANKAFYALANEHQTQFERALPGVNFQGLTGSTMAAFFANNSDLNLRYKSCDSSDTF
ncbi:MAG: hypothetical protein ACPGED_04005, partial [Flavobacteriales bacterium]